MVHHFHLYYEIDDHLKDDLQHNISSLWIWKGVSATLKSGRYTRSYPRGRYGEKMPHLVVDLI